MKRMKISILTMAFLAANATGCGASHRIDALNELESQGNGKADTWKGSEADAFEIRGVVFAFLSGGQTVPGVEVCALEAPNDICTKTDEDGVYLLKLQLDPRSSQTSVTVVFPEQDVVNEEGKEKKFVEMHSRTFLLDAQKLSEPDTAALLGMLHLQVVPKWMYTALQAFMRLQIGFNWLHADRCKVAVTASDRNKFEHGSDYAAFLEDTIHGVADAEVLLWQLSESGTWVNMTDFGPVYMDEKHGHIPTLPRAYLEATTEDGGAFFYNLDPGTYRVTAEGYDGTRFNRDVVFNCVDGEFINIGPPQLYQLAAVK
jgi:hypothetical protein